MSAPWYAAVTDSRPDAAWELYHENSKRGAGDGTGAMPRTVPPPPDYRGLPALALADRAAPPTVARPSPSPAATGQISLRAFTDLLTAGGRPMAEADPIAVFVALDAVETLSRGLAWYDPAGDRLHLLREDNVWRQLEGALASPGILRRTSALILLAANLDAATAVAGERGYRDALIAVGRHLAAIETAATAASLHLEAVGFHDRAVDALLHFDGLARSVLAVAAVAPGRG